MAEKEPPVILVDGSSYLFRAFHALPPLTNSKGQPTGAVYGVINMLRKLRDEYQPEYMAVVFDAKGKTFRHDIYKEYKAHRPPMPDDLKVQIEPLHALVRALGFPLIVVDGVEADDVIGTLATRATQQKKEMLISTGDKDLAQLVNPHVTLINTMNDEVLDETGVETKFDVPPARIIDYLTLVGDSSDNIPGVPKVGPKTAVKWLKQYDSLDKLLEHADEIKGKIGENLRNSVDELPMSRDLVTIRCDLDLGLDLDDLMMQPPDNETLHDMYVDLEFRTWLDDMAAGGSSPREKAVAADYQTVLSRKDFDAWLKKLKAAKAFAFDTETTSLDYMAARVVGVSFAVKEGEAAYVPFAHDYPGAPKQLSEKTVLGGLQPPQGTSIDQPVAISEGGNAELYVVDLDGDVFRVPEPRAIASAFALAAIGAISRLRRRVRNTS